MPQDAQAPSWTDVIDALSDLEMAAGWEPRDGGGWEPLYLEEDRLAALAQAMVFHEAGIRNRDGSPLFDVLLVPGVRPLEECVAVVDASVGNPVGADEPLSEHLRRAALLYRDMAGLEEAAGVSRLSFSSFAQRLADVSAALADGTAPVPVSPDMVAFRLGSLEMNMNVPMPVEGTPAQQAAALAARIDPDSPGRAFPPSPPPDVPAAGPEAPGAVAPQPLVGPLRAEDVPSF